MLSFSMHKKLKAQLRPHRHTVHVYNALE